MILEVFLEIWKLHYMFLVLDIHMYCENNILASQKSFYNLKYLSQNDRITVKDIIA